MKEEDKLLEGCGMVLWQVDQFGLAFKESLRFESIVEPLTCTKQGFWDREVPQPLTGANVDCNLL